MEIYEVSFLNLYVGIFPTYFSLCKNHFIGIIKRSYKIFVYKYIYITLYHLFKNIYKNHIKNLKIWQILIEGFIRKVSNA